MKLSGGGKLEAGAQYIPCFNVPTHAHDVGVSLSLLINAKTDLHEAFLHTWYLLHSLPSLPFVVA